MTQVWVIEQGSYSDYRVVGVFSSKQYAEQALAVLEERWDKPTIAEWPLDPAIEELNAGLTQWTGEMLIDGTMEDCRPASHPYDLAPSLTIWRRPTAPFYEKKGTPDCLHGTVWAKDQTHAIKIFNEHRTQLIATNQWTHGKAKESSS